ncbi:MAG: lipase family protein [Candidatus Kapaibacteriota bacterium]
MKAFAMASVRRIGLLSLMGVIGYVVVSCSTAQEPVRISSRIPEETPPQTVTEKTSSSEKETGTELQSVPSGFTSHFATWLQNNGYGSDNFSNIACYGGRTSSSDNPLNQPVIFIHGNSDRAVGTTFGQNGWTNSISHFQSQGYKSSEMYAMTWGSANAVLSAQQYHSRPYLTRVRRFIEAVLAYTGAQKVDIIGHSMGVTLARKAIKGGSASDLLNGGAYNLGSPLTSRVDAFVGIAGANWGLVSCYQTSGSTPTCAATNGLYPGYAIGPLGLSNILQDLNSSSSYEGAYRYSIWSTVDEIIGFANLVYGRYTSRIPGQTGEKVYSAVPYGHFNCKDLTTQVQLNMVKFHTTN